MKEELRVFFHLGLPKVASTYLQQEVFPYLVDFTFHRKRKFEEYKQLSKDRVKGNHLYSSERDKELTGTVEEIVNLLPGARFIFLVRRHDQWILSKYKYYIRKHGWKSFQEFFDLESNAGLWKRDELLFRRKIEQMERTSGYKPLVLTHDQLKSDPDLFLKRLTNYLDSSLTRKPRKNVIVKKAFSDKQLIVLRRFNRVFKYKKIRTPSRFVNKVHLKYWLFSLHIVAFLSQFLPGFLFKNKSLLPEAELLQKIRKYYEEDWSFCTRYAEDNGTLP